MRVIDDDKVCLNDNGCYWAPEYLDPPPGSVSMVLTFTNSLRSAHRACCFCHKTSWWPGVLHSPAELPNDRRLESQSLRNTRSFLTCILGDSLLRNKACQEWVSICPAKSQTGHLWTKRARSGSFGMVSAKEDPKDTENAWKCHIHQSWMSWMNRRQITLWSFDGLGHGRSESATALRRRAWSWDFLVLCSENEVLMEDWHWLPW